MLIREYAPLCLALDSGWGGVSRGSARIGAMLTMVGGSDGVKGNSPHLLAERATQPHRTCMAGSSRCLVLGVLVGAAGCGSDPAGVRTLPGVNISVSPDALILAVGASAPLAATVQDLEGRTLSDREIRWSSSAPTIAEVSPQGVVTALAAGLATVGAYSDQSVGFARVVVQVDFRLPVFPGSARLRSEMGTPTALCPRGEGGSRVDGGIECAHAGISRYSLDFMPQEENPAATEVGAAADGVVSDICLQAPPETTCGPNGPFVYIEHGSGFASFYAHLDPASVTVRRKRPVAQGDRLGRMGAWGNEGYPWFHFEVRYGNQDPGENPVLDALLIEGRRFADYLVGTTTAGTPPAGLHLR